MTEIKTVLAIGAHPDDLELGCGGTLAKLSARGVAVHAVVLSGGEQGAHRSRELAIKLSGPRGHLDRWKLYLQPVIARLPDLSSESACGSNSEAWSSSKRSSDGARVISPN